MIIFFIFHFRKLAVCLSERMLFFNLFSLCDVLSAVVGGSLLHLFALSKFTEYDYESFSCCFKFLWFWLLAEWKVFKGTKSNYVTEEFKWNCFWGHAAFSPRTSTELQSVELQSGRWRRICVKHTPFRTRPSLTVIDKDENQSHSTSTGEGKADQSEALQCKRWRPAKGPPRLRHAMN